VWLEGLDQLEKIHLIGTRTRDLPVCNIVPQPTTLPLFFGKLHKRGNKTEKQESADTHAYHAERDL
jgi:hypothetical protein